MLLDLRRRLSWTPQVSSLDLDRHGSVDDVRRNLRARRSSSKRRTRLSCRLRRARLHLPLCVFLPVGLGTCLLDLRFRDPDCSSPWSQRRPRRCHPVALQPRHRSRSSEHVGHHGSGRLWCFHHFRLLLSQHVRFRLVPRP
jgi:hypothetical protein